MQQRSSYRAAGASLAAWTLALVGAACAPGVEGAGDPETDRSGLREVEAPMVLVAEVVRQEMVQRLTTTAVVESELEVAVVPRSMGETVEVLAEEGDSVAAGDILARLDDRQELLARDEARIAVTDAHQSAQRLDVATQEARSRLLAAESSLGQAKRDYERDLSLAASGEGRFASVSAKALEGSKLALERAEQDSAQAALAVERSILEAAAARTNVELAEVALARAEVALAERSVRAPFAGRVARRDLRVGQQTNAGAAAFVLTDLDALRAVFYRPQRELGAFLGAGDAGSANGGGQGLELEATCDAWPGARFRGHIQRVSPTVDSASGSFRVTASLEPSAAEGPARLLPGLLVRLSLVTDRRPEALTVPKRAVQREGEQAFVWAVRDGVVQKVAVLEGYADDESVEVSPLGEAVLAAGERVITVGTRDLESGAPVRIAETGVDDEQVR